ncbi:MAG: carboxypeptidase M32 [bacterium]
MKTEMKAFLDRWAEYQDLSKASQVLEWDQETMLPEGGAPARGDHLATLAKVAHEKLVARDFRKALKEAEGAATAPRDKAMLREARRDHHRAAKIPGELVEEVTRAESRGLAAWRKAYRTSRWNDFESYIMTIVRLKRRVADAVGYAGVPYDAMLDVYEPGATVAELDPLLGALEEATKPLVRKIAASKKRPDGKIVTRKFPKDAQLAFGREVVAAMGFDFSKGRIDLSTHPFCSGFGPGDVRLTTRVFEDELKPCLFGLIHEAGHGLYEQGLDEKLQRTPVGTAVSLGIHESQSRLWENVVGRSIPFWKHFLPKAQAVFPEQLGGVSLEAFHFAVNEVVPSFIRVEADEVTYNLHIVLRYGIEKGLFDGTIRPKDLPTIWNRRMKELLGIVPERDSEGVLQDIHWGMGLYGYFPTYSLGNLYAAQIWDAVKRDMPDIESRIEEGSFLPLREWLRKKIHRWGREYPAAELMRRATGKTPDSRYFTEYVNAKYGELYDL